jgi:hypothetical protein
VNAWESDGRRFEVLMASDVVRDGMTLELTDLDQARGPGPSLEVFYSDEDGTMTFSALRPIDVPMEILTRFVEVARSNLPPSR